MTAWIERSFDAATDLSRQVLTLSTAAVALSITFLTDVAKSKTPAAMGWLGWSWAALLLAVIFSFLTLMALAGVQANAEDPEKVAKAKIKAEKRAKKKIGKRESEAVAEGVNPSIYADNVKWLGILQFIFFVGGLVLTAIAMWVGL